MTRSPSREEGAVKVTADAAAPAPAVPGHRAGQGDRRGGVHLRFADRDELRGDAGIPALAKNSGQYKAPFNTLSNEARVFTYKDTAVVTPNSDTPYSMLWMDAADP